MRIQLSDHFTMSRLVRFAFPSMVMMVFTSIYTVVDGLFVANYVGSVALASLEYYYALVLGDWCVWLYVGCGRQCRGCKNDG